MNSNKKARLKSVTGKWALRILLIFITFVTVYPLLWNLVVSFMTNTEFLTNPFAWPDSLQFDNYVRAWEKANIAKYFFNSVFITVVSVVILLIFVVPASYALSRYQFIGSRVINILYMSCLFVQATYIMVPLFLQLNRFHMLDNRLAICLVYAVLQFPFSIFLLSGFIQSIPKDYEEAAQLDGCTHWGTLRRIIVPMARPGIATVTMLTAMGFWNEYSLALVLIQSEEKKTLPVGLANLFEVQRYATDWSALFAALIIVLIPTIILYVVGQKQLLQGISMGGIKG